MWGSGGRGVMGEELELAKWPSSTGVREVRKRGGE